MPRGMPDCNGARTAAGRACGRSGARGRVNQRYPEKAVAMWEVYRKAYPKAKPFDVMSRLFAAPSRQNAVLQAERKTALGAAPSYLVLFTGQTPVLAGRPRALQCSELPFVSITRTAAPR